MNHWLKQRKRRNYHVYYFYDVNGITWWQLFGETIDLEDACKMAREYANDHGVITKVLSPMLVGGVWITVGLVGQCYPDNWKRPRHNEGVFGKKP